MIISLTPVDHEWYRIKAYASSQINSGLGYLNEYKYDKVVHIDDFNETFGSIFWNLNASLMRADGDFGNLYISCPDQLTADAVLWRAADYFQADNVRTRRSHKWSRGHSLVMNFNTYADGVAYVLGC